MQRIIIDKDDYYNNDEPVKEYEIHMKFIKNNIIKEKIELFEDFSLSLLYYVESTYLGSEYIKNEYDIRGHFNWCYGRVLEIFLEENISFYNNDDLYNYFFSFYKKNFYDLAKIKTLNQYKKYWKDMFSLENIKKSRKQFETLIEVYKKFDLSLQVSKKEKILV